MMQSMSLNTMDDLTGMWESCDSQVVQSPMAAVDTALVIVGNDKVCSTFRDSSVLSAIFPIAWRNLRDVRRFRANGRLTVVFLGRRSRQMPRYRRIHDLIFILLRRTHRQRPRDLHQRRTTGPHFMGHQVLRPRSRDSSVRDLDLRTDV